MKTLSFLLFIPYMPKQGINIHIFLHMKRIHTNCILSIVREQIHIPPELW